MLIEFDQNMMANMTAALAYVCKRIPVNKDSYDTRKRIADAMIASAHSGWRTLNDFQNVGLKVLAEITRRSRLFLALRTMASMGDQELPCCPYAQWSKRMSRELS